MLTKSFSPGQDFEEGVGEGIKETERIHPIGFCPGGGCNLEIGWIGAGYPFKSKTPSSLWERQVPGWH